jgi:hypothetical protein
MKRITLALVLCAAAGTTLADECRPLQRQPAPGSWASIVVGADIPSGHVVCYTASGLVGSQPAGKTIEELERQLDGVKRRAPAAPAQR